MLLSTYQKVIALFESGNGYRNASELKDAKITTVQIKELVNKGIVEHVSHGFYWLIDEENGKPENYQFIEACMVNPRAVICRQRLLFPWPYRQDAWNIISCHT